MSEQNGSSLSPEMEAMVNRLLEEHKQLWTSLVRRENVVYVNPQTLKDLEYGIKEGFQR
jgi:hypothetical protein